MDEMFYSKYLKYKQKYLGLQSIGTNTIYMFGGTGTLNIDELRDNYYSFDMNYEGTKINIKINVNSNDIIIEYNDKNISIPVEGATIYLAILLTYTLITKYMMNFNKKIYLDIKTMEKGSESPNIDKYELNIREEELVMEKSGDDSVHTFQTYMQDNIKNCDKISSPISEMELKKYITNIVNSHVNEFSLAHIQTNIPKKQNKTKKASNHPQSEKSHVDTDSDNIEEKVSSNKERTSKSSSSSSPSPSPLLDDMEEQISESKKPANSSTMRDENLVGSVANKTKPSSMRRTVKPKKSNTTNSSSSRPSVSGSSHSSVHSPKV